MAMVEKLLEAARKELGTKESPANSNNVKYNTWYYGQAVSGKAYPWCMAFIMWLFNQAGAMSLLPIRTASCSILMSYAKNAKLWVTGPYKAGDLVLYDWEGDGVADHVGIVESVTASGVVAIEGNTSPDEKGSQSNGGMVCRKTRALKYIKGAVRPKYEEDDDMNIDAMTDADVLKLANRMQNVLGKQPVSPTLAAELAEAKAKGITDGTNPGAFSTRAQTAVMTLRATKK